MEQIINFDGENWDIDLGGGGVHEEPYFDLNHGFYHFIYKEQIPWIRHGYIRLGIIDGRLALMYGFMFLNWYGRSVW